MSTESRLLSRVGIPATLILASATSLAALAAEGPASDWLATVEGRLAREEYRFERSTAGAHEAPNRAQGFRTEVAEGRVRVTSRVHGADASSGGFVLEWRTSRWGRPGSLEEVSHVGTDERDGALRLSLGPLVETLANDAMGLKQGFEIPAPPRGSREGGLVIEGALETDLLARPSEDGKLLEWIDASGTPVLWMSGLVVTDATGAEIPARLDVGPGRLAVVVADAAAIYPLHVDPLLSAPQWTGQSNQTGAFYGLRVSPAGDVNGDGYSDVLIGAYNYDNGQVDEGRVFLYLGSASGLSTSFARSFESNQADAKFGWALSTAGDLNGDGYDDFAVGAELYDDGQTDEGAVFVYTGAASAASIALAGTLEADQAGAWFGYSLAYGGDVDGDGDADLVVGAPDWDGGQTDEGAVFVFLGDPANVIATGAPFRAESNQAGANLGNSVAGGVDVNADGFSDVFGAAVNWDTATITGAGRVLGFYGSASGLSTTPSWTEDGAGGAFGQSVAAVGDTNGDGYADLAVGASLFTSTLSGEGRVYLYRGSSTGLLSSPSQTRDGGVVGISLGKTVAPAGDVNGDGFADVAAGASGADPGGVSNAGEVRVWHGSPTGLGATASWTYDGVQANSGVGESVFTAGDVDGDGYADLIVGAGGFDTGAPDGGQAYVFLGSGDGLVATAQGTMNVNDPSGSGTLGWVVASAGDVNADGFSDVVIGAPFHRLGGAAWIHLGSATGINPTPQIEILGSVNDSQFGYGVAGIGDIDGDGYDDVAIGAPSYYFDSNRGFYAGRVFVYHGGATGVDGTADDSYPTFQPSTILFDDRFGETICGVGDANGDGYADFYASGNSQSTFYGGPASPTRNSAPVMRYADSCSGGDVDRDGYSDLVIGDTDDDLWEIYRGGPGGYTNTPAWTVFDSENLVSAAVAMAGDVNGDGHVDVVTSSDPLLGSAATIRVYLGSATGPDTTADQTFTVPDGVEAIDSAGDVNGDGFSDLIIGSHKATTAGGASAGRAAVYLGSASGLSATAAFVRDGTVVGGDLGRGVAGGLDVNGDGFSDVVIGEPGRGDGFAYVHLGGGGDGLEYIARNERGDNTGPAALLGSSGSSDRFRILSRGRTPRGRALVAMDHQVAPLPTPLSSGTSLLGSYFDTGTTDSAGADVNFNRLVSGLTAVTPYKWRMRFRAKDPIFRYTRWISLPGNSREETDVRTSCSPSTWYRDADGDTFGTSLTTQSACAQPAGYVAISGDCNDADPTMFPGNPEVCDGKDNDCAGGIDDGFPAPAGTPTLSASKSGIVVNLSWPAVPGADRYDVVSGGLGKLRNSAGDFAQATLACVADDTSSPSASDATDPAPVAGLWYLARGVNCNAAGTYDGQAPPQRGSRDAEILASGAGCP